MPGELVEGLSRLSQRVDELLRRDAESRDRERVYRLRIAQLEEELAAVRAEVSRLERAQALGSAAVSLGPNSEDSRRARRLVGQLLREIDGCISLLRG